MGNGLERELHEGKWETDPTVIQEDARNPRKSSNAAAAIAVYNARRLRVH